MRDQLQGVINNNLAQEAMNLESEIVGHIKHDLGITHKAYNNLNAINVYKNMESQDFLSTGVAYVFFTRPSLHFGDKIDPTLKNIPFYKNVTKETFFKPCPFIDDIVNRKSRMYENVLHSLKGGFGYVALITNLCQNFEAQDLTTEVTTANDTFKGFKLSLPSSHSESLVGGTFSINFNETRNMDVTVFHKIWVDYIEGIRRGVLVPSTDSIRSFNKSNVKNNGYIDYMNSAYYFLLDADGKTIKYYAKYTGVFPTSVPYSSFNWEIGSSNLKKVTINYQYNYKEDMNPEILREFNYVMSSSSYKGLDKISDEKLKEYVKSQKAENNWRRLPKIFSHETSSGQVSDILLFEK